MNSVLLYSSCLPKVSACDTLTCQENFRHVDRTTEFNVLIYVTDGAMYVTEDGIDYEISAGEMLLLRSGLRHFGKHETLRGTSWLYVHFHIPLPDCQDDALALPKKLCGLKGSVHEDKLFQLNDLFHSSEPLKEFRVNLMLCELFVNLCSETARRERASDQICAYLNTQTDKNFSKRLVEKNFFLSYSHMAAEFRKEQGMSMGEYHNSVRMKEACRLLRSTLTSVGEIAEQLGFSDVLYFSKKFHAFVGISPTEYRKQSHREY
ncbi:MAG: helix-turn-helix transcriptional regulator [Clostridia bacterium]|nr:helix-turn-helix transcriptional regulator [Clostridia bacterium]